MQKNTTTILGITSAVFGLLLFLTSVTGLLFGAATPVTDPGMLWTSVTFVLMGVLAYFLGQRQEVAA